MASQQEKCAAFEALHKGSEIFIIPNPYDIGSARVLENLGFKALATTSSGVAQTLGKGDGEVTLAEKIAHCRLMASATAIPINVDFEDGYARKPEEVASNVMAIAETGVAGCSIEDFDRKTKELLDFNLAVERMQAAAEAIAGLGMPFQLIARAENHLRGVQDLDDTIARLNAFADVGADVLYPPGLHSLDDVKTVVQSVSRPVNVLAVLFRGVSVADFAAAGVRRLSVGGALARLSLGPIVSAGREMLEQGTFDWTAGMPDLGGLLVG